MNERNINQSALKVSWWGWLVSWSSLVCWLIFWVLGSTFVLDISNISSIIVNSVGDSLDTTIRKVDRVGSRSQLAIGSLRLAKFGTRVVISHSVLKVVRLWCFVIWS